MWGKRGIFRKLRQEGFFKNGPLRTPQFSACHLLVTFLRRKVIFTPMHLIKDEWSPVDFYHSVKKDPVTQWTRQLARWQDWAHGESSPSYFPLVLNQTGIKFFSQMHFPIPFHHKTMRSSSIDWEHPVTWGWHGQPHTWEGKKYPTIHFLIWPKLFCLCSPPWLDMEGNMLLRQRKHHGDSY